MKFFTFRDEKRLTLTAVSPRLADDLHVEPDPEYFHAE